MTTREYFRHLRGELYRVDREACLDIWLIAQAIGDSHNFPREALIPAAPWGRESNLLELTAEHYETYRRWLALPKGAEGRYVDLLHKIAHVATYGRIERNPTLNDLWK